QLLQDLEPVTVTELKIEDNAVVFVHQCQRTGLFSRGGGINRVRFIAQDSRYELQYRFIVVDYQNAHSYPLIRLSRVQQVREKYRLRADKVAVHKKGREPAPSPFSDPVSIRTSHRK